AERFVSVLGQVRSPSLIPLPEESNSLGILQAVTLAGGFTRIARTDSVQVSRTNADGVEERFEIDVRELLNSRRSKDKREFQLLAGDVVFVPERTI
ncbi:MAG: polysaccharide biosynthesis/export family protein, partial [Opitutaceae bacterium]